MAYEEMVKNFSRPGGHETRGILNVVVHFRCYLFSLKLLGCRTLGRSLSSLMAGVGAQQHAKRAFVKVLPFLVVADEEASFNGSGGCFERTPSAGKDGVHRARAPWS